MEENRVYYRELDCYEREGKKQKTIKGSDGYYDLTKLPTNKMQDEMRLFILERGKTVAYNTIRHDKTYYNQLCTFLNQINLHSINSFLDKPQEKWIQLLKGWMLQSGKPITYEKLKVYDTKNVITERLIQYFKWVLIFLQPKDERDEIEKDVWRLDALKIEYKNNPIYNVLTLDFRKIVQPDIRDEVKKAIFMNLKYEAVGTIQRELTAIRKFSGYLKTVHPQIVSCMEIDRDVLEGYLIHQNTGNGSHKSNSDNILKLRNLLEEIGKIYGYTNLESLFLITDIPPEIQPEFKDYSDEEVKRLNASITKLDEQIARCLVIHQMLETRISDIQTLECDCLYMVNGQHMIRIHQVKTNTFEKLISAELSELIQKAHDYTKNKYGETKYIFVDEGNTSRPMQCTTIKHKIKGMILKENLLDDEGNLFQFSTHLFRHYYGVKLTEMHLDDWTIARLLGHRQLRSVQHYRKMSNQKLADETREILNMMTEILYKNLDGWGEEYEQIRQND